MHVGADRYVEPNSFRINTYEKTGEGGQI